MSNRLGGKQGTAYLGTNANQPPNMVYATRDPDQYDINYSIGDIWINTATLTLWALVSLQGTTTSKGAKATWIHGNGGVGVQTLTGTTGTNPVSGDTNDNINLFSSIGGLDVQGNSTAHTLTLTAAGGGNLITKLQGSDGSAAVSSDPATNIIKINSKIAAFKFTSTGAAPYTLDFDFTGTGPGSVLQTLSGSNSIQVTPTNGDIGIISTIPGLTVVENAAPVSTLVLTSASGNGYIETLTGDDTIPVASDITGNLNLVTDTNLPALSFISGGGNTLKLSVNGTGPGTLGQTITTGDAVVVPADSNGNWNVIGDGTYIHTEGDATSHTVTVSYVGPVPVGFAWQQTTSAAVALVTMNGYIANNAVQTVFTLPITAAVGDVFAVTGMNNNYGWRINHNAGQTIYFGDQQTTTGLGGYLESTSTHDVVHIVCMVANTSFFVDYSIGNITVA